MVTPQTDEARKFMQAWLEGTTLPPFISRAIIEPWQKPIPGPSLIKRNRDRQLRDRTWPVDTGSLYMPSRQHADSAIAPCLNTSAEENEIRKSAEEVQKFAAIAELEDLDVARGNLRRSIELGNLATEVLMQRIQNGDEEAASAVAENQPRPEGRGDAGNQDAQCADDPAANNAEGALDKHTALPGGAGGSRARVFEMPRLRKPRSSDAQPEKGSAQNARPKSKATPAELAAGSVQLQSEIDTILERGSGRRRSMRDLDARDLLAISAKGNQCAWMLARVATMRRKAADHLIEVSLRANRKMEFYDSRIRGIIGQTFLALEDKFRDLGFGGWMPFRFPDQWLAFSDLMQRLCAANGLMSPKGPNHWAKFIQETPPVPNEEFPQAPLKLPEGLGANKEHREINDLDELVARARGAPP